MNEWVFEWDEKNAARLLNKIEFKVTNFQIIDTLNKI